MKHLQVLYLRYKQIWILTNRDRLAFLRICSGTFERGMNVTLSRTGKQMKLSQSTHLMANERET